MSDFYARLADVALKQIEDKGRTVTLEKDTNQFDPQTGVNVQTTVQTATKAVFTEFTLDEFNGTTVQTGDKKVLLAAKSLTEAPTNEYRLVDQSETYSINPIETVQPGDTPLLYKVSARR